MADVHAFSLSLCRVSTFVSYVMKKEINRTLVKRNDNIDQIDEII